MKHILLFLFLFTACSLFAQGNEKGAKPLVAETSAPSGVTRAVVIGISDYQNLPDLRFADRDAQAFATWLQSESGGKLPAEHILLLLNQQATAGKVGMALMWLVTESKAGDRAIIYFSGHGDVESKLLNQPGYLLCCDAPPNVYMGSGSPKISDIQEVVNTLTLVNKAKVLLVTDACRAGKLAGSDIAGVQITNYNLAKPFGDEVKILSCQPNEFSLEGEQWGDGRGVFSYHLVDGLYGMADRDGNGAIKVKEIGRYLEDMVPAEVAPQPQNPLIVGDREALLAFVSGEELAKIREMKRGQQPVISPSDMRGYDGVVLIRADSSVREMYEAFLAAVASGKLMPDAGNPGKSADDYYRVLIREQSIQPLHGLMTRNFVAALADEAQLVVNKLLRTDPAIADDAFPGRVRYAHLPAYLARAAEILGPGHYLYRYLKAKQYYFEAKTYTKAQYPGLSPDSLFKLSNEALDKGLQHDPEAAFIHLEKGVQYFWNAQPEVATESFDKALKLSPTWVLAIYYYARAIDFTGDRPKAVHYLKKALRYDSTFLPVYERLGYFTSGPEQIYWRNEYIRRFKQWEERAPTDIPPVYMRYMGLTFHNLGRNEEAEKYLLRGAEMTSWEDPLYYKQLGMVYEVLGRRADMCRCYDKYFEVHPKNYETYTGLTLCGKYSKVRKFVMQWHQQDTTILDALDVLWLLERANHRSDLVKKIDEKIIALLEFTRIHDQNLLLKGNYYWWYGQPIKAEITLKEYINGIEASGDQDLIHGLGGEIGAYNQLACVKMVQGDWQEAEFWWLKRDALSGDTTGNGWRQWIAFSRGQMDEVKRLDSLAKSRKQIPAIETVLSDMLFLAAVYDLFDLAINRLENAREHYPEHTMLHYHLARLYLEHKNDYDKGVQLLNRAVQFDSTFALAHYHLAAAYAHLGKYDAALEHLEKALENSYEDWEELAADAHWAGLRGTAGFEGLVGRYRKE